MYTKSEWFLRVRHEKNDCIFLICMILHLSKDILYFRFRPIKTLPLNIHITSNLVLLFLFVNCSALQTIHFFECSPPTLTVIFPKSFLRRVSRSLYLFLLIIHVCESQTCPANLNLHFLISFNIIRSLKKIFKFVNM